MSGTPPDPGPIVRLSTAYWDSQTLLTANRLRVFDVIADGAKSGDSIAAALGLDPRATGLFLRACAGLGLLQENDGEFSNSPAAAGNIPWDLPGFSRSATSSAWT